MSHRLLLLVTVGVILLVIFLVPLPEPVQALACRHLEWVLPLVVRALLVDR